MEIAGSSETLVPCTNVRHTREDPIWCWLRWELIIPVWPLNLFRQLHCRSIAVRIHGTTVQTGPTYFIVTSDWYVMRSDSFPAIIAVIKQNTECTYKVILWSARLTIVVVETQQWVYFVFLLIWTCLSTTIYRRVLPLKGKDVLPLHCCRVTKYFVLLST
jgi:hypothetical protein